VKVELSICVASLATSTSPRKKFPVLPKLKGRTPVPSRLLGRFLGFSVVDFAVAVVLRTVGFGKGVVGTGVEGRSAGFEDGFSVVVVVLVVVSVVVVPAVVPTVVPVVVVPIVVPAVAVLLVLDNTLLVAPSSTAIS
jgi:hypothetical protein